MAKPMSNFSFRLMTLFLSFRDLFINPADILKKEAGIKPGLTVLDYGCGPGSFSIAAAKMVTGTGRIYALDILPVAVDKVRREALKRNLTNIVTIQSECATGLQDGSIDVVLLYDILHGLEKPNDILAEIHRVLTPDGILSFSDHHLKPEQIESKINELGLFRLVTKGEKIYNFSKV